MIHSSLRAIDAATVAAALGTRDLRFNEHPFLVGPIARMAKFAAVVTPTGLYLPHR